MTFLRRCFVLLAIAAALGPAAGCGSDAQEKAPAPSTPSDDTSRADAREIQRNPANAAKAITVASKNFTEEFILGEIYAQALAAGGYRVRKKLDYGSELVAFRGVRRGDIDAYPEYTGTALTTFFDVAPSDIPRDEKEAFDQARERFAERGLTALPPTPFTDSNAVGMTRSRAGELRVKTISDLKGKAGELTLAGSPECSKRVDCKLGLEEVYGLRFKRYLPTALEKRHSVLTRAVADVSIVFTTDGQISAEDLVVLEDDENLFPPYNVTLVVNDKVAREAGPDLPRIVALVQKDLSTTVMQELNSRVDLDKEKPADVARAYLEQYGYVKRAG